MGTMEIRKRLFDYIRSADDKKVKAIYTIFENEIQQEQDIWTEEFYKKMITRASDFENGEVAGLSWSDVKENARKLKKTKGV